MSQVKWGWSIRRQIAENQATLLWCFAANNRNQHRQNQFLQNFVWEEQTPCCLQALKSWLEVLVNNFLKVPTAYHSCANSTTILPGLIILEYNPCRGRMSICIFMLATSTVCTRESLIMVGLRDMREPQRKKRFPNWPSFLLLPWFLRKPQGSFSCFSTNRMGRILKKNWGRLEEN